MENSASEYQLSLEYLLKSYGIFVLSLRDYLAARSPSRQLHSLLHIWNHPRGIYNLIRTLALQFAAHNNDDARLRPVPDGPVPTLPIIPIPTLPSGIEVTNPRFATECAAVKVEESQGESAAWGQGESGGAG
jgi:hypothetical protein